jgi:hypothetical protein
MSRARLLVSFVLGLLLCGCLARRPPVQAAHPATVAVAACMGVLTDPAVQPVPAEIDAAVLGLLAARNLRAQPLAPAAFLEPFAARRTTPHRLALVAEQAGGAELILLVETTVAFYSEMNGRYRWTVEVDATVSPRDDLSQAFSAHFQVPVFLEHYREREPEALRTAAPLVERRLGALLDAWLGGM